jgi:tripartite motif-containing protein 71
VTDRDRHEVILYSYKSGIPVPVFRFGEYGEEPHQFRRPTGIAVDALNFRLIIADKDNHRISVYSIDGHFIFTFGRNGHGEGEFNYPWGVAVCPNGTYIAVADSRNYRVQLFDASGKFLRKFSVFETDPFNYKQEFHYPRGICFDNAGNYLIPLSLTMERI